MSTPQKLARKCTAEPMDRPSRVMECSLLFGVQSLGHTGDGIENLRERQKRLHHPANSHQEWITPDCTRLVFRTSLIRLLAIGDTNVCQQHRRAPFTTRPLHWGPFSRNAGCLLLRELAVGRNNVPNSSPIVLRVFDRQR